MYIHIGALFWRTDIVVMTAIETMNFNVYSKDGTRTGEKYNQGKDTHSFCFRGLWFERF
jgi:hypothetical protein